MQISNTLPVQQVLLTFFTIFEYKTIVGVFYGDEKHYDNNRVSYDAGEDFVK